MRNTAVILMAIFSFTVTAASLVAVVNIGARALTAEAAYANAMKRLNRRSNHKHANVVPPAPITP